MLLNSQRDVLRAYSKGRIGWREACSKLGLEQFSELKTVMDAEGLSLYQPDAEESSNRMRELEKLMYGEDEI